MAHITVSYAWVALVGLGLPLLLLPIVLGVVAPAAAAGQVGQLLGSLAGLLVPVLLQLVLNVMPPTPRGAAIVDVCAGAG